MLRKLGEISCRHAHELISQRMDDKLPLAKRMRLWAHLRMCELCSRVEVHMEFMRKAMHRLGR